MYVATMIFNRLNYFFEKQADWSETDKNSKTNVLRVFLSRHRPHPFLKDTNEPRILISIKNPARVSTLFRSFSRQ